MSNFSRGKLMVKLAKNPNNIFVDTAVLSTSIFDGICEPDYFQHIDDAKNKEIKGWLFDFNFDSVGIYILNNEIK